MTILSSKLNKESSPLSLNVHKKNESSNYSIEKENGEKIMWSDNSSGNEYKVSYKKFNGAQIKSLYVSKGAELSFKFNSKVENGNLKIQIKDENEKVLANAATNKEDAKKIKINYDGKLFIHVIGKDTKGFFNISYNQ
ncbi:hypothetical protein FC820_06890 [Clostridium sporogenes]|uniref:hypothetical protein n=1 Tax=Clostridium sporogenes TaxID=1509 RepID=UPI0013D35D94|nr:hypothetical protein [Clostridium sporogenes]EJE7235571.1 hypothetical protein [Clostridium botulinum]EJE7237004.1 hypothetical protein [Clostridium botulinum]NFE80806.1 hypothetical protein [Clostridium sporogenes]NFG68061.1 hypothetical protein [Clostridium sporogenes]HDK7168636.1 hypothetical protein [Clostridium botulinum]